MLCAMLHLCLDHRFVALLGNSTEAAMLNLLGRGTSFEKSPDLGAFRFPCHCMNLPVPCFRAEIGLI